MGRPPKDPEKRKSEPVSIRLTPALRARLENERKKAEPERTLSQEIEARLRESLNLEEEIEKRFHSRRNYYVVRMIADGIAEWIEPLTHKSCWENAYTFDQARDLMNEIMKHLRPKGRGKTPERFKNVPEGAFHSLSLGQWVAQVLLVTHRLEAKGIRHDARYSNAGPNIAAQFAKSNQSLLLWDHLNETRAQKERETRRGTVRTSKKESSK